MKKYIDDLKVLWCDERGRALIKLGLYFIFIVVAVLYTRSLYSGSTPVVEKKDVMEVFSSKQEYTETITIDEETYSLQNGKILTFEDEDNLYNVIDDRVFLLKEDVTLDFIIPFWKISPKFITTLIKNKKTFYVTEYNDNTKDTAYQISLSEFVANFVDDVDVKLDEKYDKQNIVIVIHNTTKEIDKVTLDLSTYYQYLTDEIKEYKIEIEY